MLTMTVMISATSKSNVHINNNPDAEEEEEDSAGGCYNDDDNADTDTNAIDAAARLDSRFEPHLFASQTSVSPNVMWTDILVPPPPPSPSPLYRGNLHTQ